ncbi:N-acetyl-alpha-D-glucosaminyl L-malate synthase BshA [Deinococcus yavapaiensis]|uniref:N-acetyl-alpha-D-glucosaminyl L-malate synthase BshA n=1 Tax=Deinococcus yavapaiensis KR-236 TaxID=694435 RepID=A0A318S7U0_9DEIO|nr:N-acetyl-alpha-D-glucosaminyl L-malate synthase BshA [Deinococcus yavapaiensis]PYE54927.1 N-acetyl-alpha-D-glucosaminyl L-malate synthase BshA [Deinococcus yavapaiensis KR-236]
MNIAVLCHASAGGSGVVATELGLLVAEAGHSVHFIGNAMPFRLSNHKLSDGPYFHQVGSYAYALFDQPFPELAQANVLAEVISEHGVDITHAHYAIPHATSAIHARGITGRTRVMTTLHGTDVTLVGVDRAFRHSTKYAIERSDRVTAVSHFLADQTRDLFDVDVPIDVIHNFVDTDRFTRNEDPRVRARFAHPDEAILVHVSNFRPIKRTHEVVEIFARVASEMPARLLMIGDGPERARAFELAQALGVLGRVQFLGSFPDVETVLSIADLFVLPSEKESFGLVALEAMSCEVPVVASDIGGIPEVVASGETGVLCALGDIDGMAHAALSILSDSPTYRRMAKAARQRARDHFHPSLILPRYLQAYERLLT